MPALVRFLIGVSAAIVTACSAAPPAGSPPSTVPTTSAATAPATVGTTADPTENPEPTASAAGPTDAPPASEPAATPSAGSTTFTLVLADGPRAGTWVVTEPAGAVPNCKYLPDLDRWIATWFGPPPLTFMDVRGESEDPSLLFTFAEEDESEELSFLPSGDVTFEVDDRGDTATLSWVSEENGGTYFDSQGQNTGEAEMGQAELTIECGSIFRYS